MVDLLLSAIGKKSGGTLWSTAGNGGGPRGLLPWILRNSRHLQLVGFCKGFRTNGAVSRQPPGVRPAGHCPPNGQRNFRGYMEPGTDLSKKVCKIFRVRRFREGDLAQQAADVLDMPVASANVAGDGNRKSVIPGSALPGY